MTAISAIDSVVSNVRRSIQNGDKFPIGTHRVHNWQQQVKERLLAFWREKGQTKLKNFKIWACCHERLCERG